MEASPHWIHVRSSYYKMQPLCVYAVAPQAKVSPVVLHNLHIGVANTLVSPLIVESKQLRNILRGRHEIVENVILLPLRSLSLDPVRKEDCSPIVRVPVGEAKHTAL